MGRLVAVKGMEMPKCCCVCPCFNDEYCYCQAADKDLGSILIDCRHPDCPLIEVSEWISVAERLPEENGRYLTVMHRTVYPQYRNELGDDDTEVRITRYHQGEWKVPLHSPKWINEAITDTVTHWMPLPELPKDGET